MLERPELRPQQPFVDQLAIEVSRRGLFKGVFSIAAGFVASHLVPRHAFAASDINWGRGECRQTGPDSVVSGDILVDGRRLFPRENDGMTGFITKFHQSAMVCSPFGASGIEGTPEEVARWTREQIVRNRDSGCTERKGCISGTEVIEYPSQRATTIGDTTTCKMETGLVPGQVISEPIRDVVICKDPQVGRQPIGEWCWVQGDADVFVDGEKVFSQDENPKTGQITRIHTAKKVHMDLSNGADVECIGEAMPSAMEVMDRRSGSRAKEMVFTGCENSRGCSEGVLVVDVWPGGNVQRTLVK